MKSKNPKKGKGNNRPPLPVKPKRQNKKVELSADAKAPAILKKASPFDHVWILKNALPIVRDYGQQLTIRALHYRLVAAGMTNDQQHYKKVCSSMANARWDGVLRFESFLDHERQTIGSTPYEPTTVDEKVGTAKHQIKLWANNYSKNRWENQPIYPEVFIEKKALQGMFEKPCREMDVALNPCKGYPSLTFLNDAARRISDAVAEGKEPIILYFGDYDCTGEDIPRSIQDNLDRLGCAVEVRRVALFEDQVIKWKLPPAPTKTTDSRAAAWDGLGQVELDAVEPRQLIKLIETSLNSVFDSKLYAELQVQQQDEKKKFQRILKRDFSKLLD